MDWTSVRKVQNPGKLLQRGRPEIVTIKLGQGLLREYISFNNAVHKKQKAASLKGRPANHYNLFHHQ